MKTLKKIQSVSLAMVAVIFLASPAFSSSFSIGEYLDVSGFLRFEDGSTLSLSTSSNLRGADGHSPVLSWFGDQIAIDDFVTGPHLTGPTGQQGVQGIQGIKGDSFTLTSTSYYYPSNQSEVWLTNTEWLPVVEPMQFTVSDAASYFKIFWSDNVGIWSNNWCNVGLFLDDALSPFCAGAWSGVSGTSIFNQQYVQCVLPPQTVGSHTITIKHRSQYCFYGNSAFDEYGIQRQLSLEEIR